MAENSGKSIAIDPIPVAFCQPWHQQRGCHPIGAREPPVVIHEGFLLLLAAHRVSNEKMASRTYYRRWSFDCLGLQKCTEFLEKMWEAEAEFLIAYAQEGDLIFDENSPDF